MVWPKAYQELSEAGRWQKTWRLALKANLGQVKGKRLELETVVGLHFPIKILSFSISNLSDYIGAGAKAVFGLKKKNDDF